MSWTDHLWQKKKINITKNKLLSEVGLNIKLLVATLYVTIKKIFVTEKDELLL